MNRKRRSSLKIYLDEKEKIGSYDCKKRAKRIVDEVKMGVIPPFMIEEVVNMDTSIPEFAREQVIEEAQKMLAI